MYLFDTYALIEIIKGNKNYSKYIDSTPIINKFILTELTYWMIRDYGFDKASLIADQYNKYVKEIDLEVIKEAMLFRYLHKKQKLSMIDCIGYIMAKKLGLKFLTGDKEFEKFDNVEFVK